MRDTPTPPLSDWFELAPLFVLREAEERGIHVEPPAQLSYALFDKRLTNARGEVTHYGRRRLNRFLDMLGMSTAERRAIVRRLASKFGAPTP